MLAGLPCVGGLQELKCLDDEWSSDDSSRGGGGEKKGGGSSLSTLSGLESKWCSSRSSSDDDSDEEGERKARGRRRKKKAKVRCCCCRERVTGSWCYVTCVSIQTCTGIRALSSCVVSRAGVPSSTGRCRLSSSRGRGAAGSSAVECEGSAWCPTAPPA